MNLPATDELARMMYAALEKLVGESDGTPSGVAVVLERHGIKGDIEDCNSCPVALWLVAELQAGGLVAAGQYEDLAEGLYVDVNSGCASLHGPAGELLARVDMPDELGTFIISFDDHAFPELVDS